MELALVLVAFLIAIVLGITPPIDRSTSVEDGWTEASFE